MPDVSTSKTIPDFHTPAEVALRLNRLQDEMEELKKTIEVLVSEHAWMLHHRHAVECDRFDSGEPFQ